MDTTLLTSLAGLAAGLVTTLQVQGASRLEWIIQDSSRIPSELRLHPERDEHEGNATLGDLENALQVYVVEEGVDPLSNPPVDGSYLQSGKVVIFRPTYPFSDRIDYLAVAFDGVQALHRSSKQQNSPVARVDHIQPEGEILPENLLKFYIHFSHSMSGGDVYRHIQLIELTKKKVVQWPFLELGEELWNQDRTRLTLFIDPGRIKRGVKPLEEIGTSLEEGKDYELIISNQWKDAKGTSLANSFRKSFRIGPPDRSPIALKRWTVESPRAETRQPLVIHFGESLDAALVQRCVSCLRGNQELEGEISINSQTTRWTFIPSKPWSLFQHTIKVHTLLEDLAGNNVGKPFEVDTFAPVQRRLESSHETLHFTPVLDKTP